MNYEQKYKAALGWMQGLYNGLHGKTKEEAETYFPELKESEDEKLRKEIISALKWANHKGVYDKHIAWLEKQGEKRMITHEEICKSYGIPGIGEFSDGYHTFNGLYHQRMILFAVLVKTYKNKAWKSWKHEDGLDCFGGGWFIVGIDTPAGSYTYHYKAKDWNRFDCQVLEKAKHWDGHDENDVERLFTLVQSIEGNNAFEVIKDEKVDNANKIKPKFKVGDWIVQKNNWIVQKNIGVYKVIEICNLWYEVIDSEDNHYKISYDKECMCHLWSIEDAKDGDVLISQYNKPFIYNGNRESFFLGTYCGVSTADRFIVTTEKCSWTENVDIQPATKEQRDLLFQKMREAGYEWDAEKKELKQMKGGEK